MKPKLLLTGAALLSVTFTTQLHADLRNQIAEAERQKKAVPKF